MWPKNDVSSMIPETMNVQKISHNYLFKDKDPVFQFKHVYGILEKYAQAKLIVTSRIHAALPCVAMGIPVVFINTNILFRATPSTPSPRVTGLLDLFHTVDLYKISQSEAISYLKGFDWENPPPNPNPEKHQNLTRNACRILSKVEEFRNTRHFYELNP